MVPDAKITAKKNYLLTVPTTWTNPDGSILALTGWSAEVTIRTDYVENNGTLIKTFTSAAPSDNGDTVAINISTGIVTVTVKPATTNLFTGGQDYFMELTLVNPSSEPALGLTFQLLAAPSVR
jgi:hypothetical protein